MGMEDMTRFTHYLLLRFRIFFINVSPEALNRESTYIDVNLQYCPHSPPKSGEKREFSVH